MEQGNNYFKELNAINVNDRTERKGNLTYLSWAWAWGEVKKLHPDMTSRVYESADGCLYHTDGRTAWVKVGVTIEGIEYIEYLPVMDNRNNSIPLDKITSRNASDSIQRALTKAIARHGLGLYIYAGEDLPNDEADEKKDWSGATVAKRATNVMTAKQVDAISALVKETFAGHRLTRDAFEAVTGYTVQQLAARQIPADQYDTLVSKLTLEPEDAMQVIEEIENGRATA